MTLAVVCEVAYHRSRPRTPPAFTPVLVRHKTAPNWHASALMAPGDTTLTMLLKV